MIPALRIARRFIRKLTKPICLMRNRHQMAVSEQTVRCLQESREEACRMLDAEHRYQVKLEMQRRQIANW